VLTKNEIKVEAWERKMLRKYLGGKTDMEDGGEKKEIKSKRVVTMWIMGCNI
jgi:hypothetical protein